jgi:hypothetical protein
MFDYNETLANDYFPLLKEEVLQKGWKWYDIENKEYQKREIKAPDCINDAPDSICNEILSCETSGKSYKIISQELHFYRNMKLPIPHKCPDVRNTERIIQRNGRILYDRKCVNCGADIQTNYSENQKESIYCEKCYLQTVL